MSTKEPAFDTLRLWSADTLVLYAWLNTVDFEAIPTTERAVLQALTDLLTSIELNTGAEYASEAEFRAAHELVAKNMAF